MTWKFYGRPRKPKGHLLYTMSSTVHHFKAIGEFKLELMTGNAKFGSKLMIFFLSCVTLKFDGWPWKTIGHFFYATSSCVHHFIAICKFSMELQSRNAKFGSKSAFFVSCDPDFDGWPWKTIQHFFYATSSFVHHFIAICKFKMELQSGNAKFGSKSAIFLPVWPWYLTDDLEKQ